MDWLDVVMTIVYLLCIPAAILYVVVAAMAVGREQERERHQAEKETRDENQTD